MSDPLTITPPRRYGPAATPEALFRARAAGLHETAAPRPANPDVVLIESEDGVVVFPPSEKLVILAAVREARAKA